MAYRDESPPSLLAIGVVCCVGCGGLGALFEFSVSGREIGQFDLMSVLGCGIVVFGIFGLPVISWFARKSLSVYRTGINWVAGAAAASYWLTGVAISPFMVMVMPIWMRAIGLLFGIAGNVWWCLQIFFAYKKIISSQGIFGQLYVDAGNFYVMTPSLDARVVERQLKFNQMLPAYFLVPMVSVVPVAFVLEKVLEPILGFVGFWAVVAFFAIPLSMIFNGLLVKGFFMYFYCPSKWARLTGKSVHFARFWCNDEWEGDTRKLFFLGGGEKYESRKMRRNYIDDHVDRSGKARKMSSESTPVSGKINRRYQTIFHMVVTSVVFAAMSFPSDDPRVRAIRWPLVIGMPVVVCLGGMLGPWIFNAIGVCFLKSIDYRGRSLKRRRDKKNSSR
ncbi:MAG: hypothetical protein V4801_16195 [Burkholderia gladioli]